MKKLILLTLPIITLCTSFMSPHIHEPNVQLTVSYAGSWSDTYYGSYDSYHASIINRGSDTVYFINATCSYVEAFTTDSKKAGVLNRHNCYKNGILCYSIAPGGSHEYNIDVRPLPGIDDSTTFRIGFIWVEPVVGFYSFESFHEQIQSRFHNVIWSERLKLR